MVAFQNTDNVTILTRKDRTKSIINKEDNQIIFLPPCDNGVMIEILMLEINDITLDTNSNTSLFLRPNYPRKLTIKGGDETLGKNLVLQSYEGFWRIVSTTLDESLLTFEE